MSNATTLLRALSSTLETAGFEEPFKEAEELLLSGLKIGKTALYRDNPPVEKPLLKRIKTLLKRRLKRVPLQYLTGYTEFFELKIFTPPGVFIPRPETETLVEETLNLIREEGLQKSLILDLCTGTGCIALCLALHLPDAVVYGVDISERAINTAVMNASVNSIKNVYFLKGDLFEPVKGRRFRLIVSNPPYVKSIEIEGLPPEIRLYEPLEALYAGRDGLEFYRRILHNSGDFLEDDGYLLLELGIGQASQISAMARDRGFSSVKIIKDLSGVDRVIILRKE
jgi:release factor glutamine methyltransferase